MKGPGRPRSSKLDRVDQLREAKRRQREREREAGLVHVQLALPRQVASKLRAAARSSGFPEALDVLLDQFVIRLEEYPALRDIAWNLADEFVSAKDAFGLYERNWRFVNPANLDEREQALIRSLSERFGGGIIHA